MEYLQWKIHEKASLLLMNYQLTIHGAGQGSRLQSSSRKRKNKLNIQWSNEISILLTCWLFHMRTEILNNCLIIDQRGNPLVFRSIMEQNRSEKKLGNYLKLEPRAWHLLLYILFFWEQTEIFNKRFQQQMQSHTQKGIKITSFTFFFSGFHDVVIIIFVVFMNVWCFAW